MMKEPIPKTRRNGAGVGRRAARRQRNRSCRVERLEQRVVLSGPTGDEFLVNQFVPGQQDTSRDSPAVAARASGEFVVTYSGKGPGDNSGVFAQRFNAFGSALGSEFRVNQTVWLRQYNSSVAVNDAGQFVIVWSGYGEGDSSGVFARAFDSGGAPASGEIRVNDTRLGIQNQPTVAMAEDGGFVVAWSGRGRGDSNGVFLRRFHADGSAAGDEVRVNATTRSMQQQPTVVIAPDGQLLVAWSGRGPGDSQGIFLRRLHADGSPAGAETHVNFTRSGTQDQPAIAVDDAGRFAVVWRGKGPGDNSGIFLRRFDEYGPPLSGEIRVNSTTSHAQTDPSISMSGDGSFAVTWSSWHQDGSHWGVFAREFDAHGDPNGDEFQVNTTSSRSQHFSSVAKDERHDYVIAWSGKGDGDNDGVFARQFVQEFDAPVIVAALANDTGKSADDGLTFDPAVAGSVTDASHITVFRAGFDDTSPESFFDILVALNPNGSFTLDEQQLAQINGEPLSEGAHTLHVRAADEHGNMSDIFDLDFRLDVTPPIAPAFVLHPDFDSDPPGDNETFLQIVNLVGQTDADTQVGLLGSSVVITSGTGGGFQLVGVPLTLGGNALTMQATDAAGNASAFTSTIIRTVPETDAILLAENGQFVVEAFQAIALGQPQGSRILQFQVDTGFDLTDQTSVGGDLLLVYLVDPADPTQTLLDGGAPGTAFFALGEDGAQFTPGQVTNNGSLVTLDLSSLSGHTQGLLKFQFLSTDTDTGSQVAIRSLSNTLDSEGVVRPVLNLASSPAPVGAPLGLGDLHPTSDLEVRLEHVRFNASTGAYTADARVRNLGADLGRDIALVLRGLPAGVALVNASGNDGGDPYINMKRAIPFGGLASGETSEPVSIEISNPGLTRFSIVTESLVGAPNRTPVWDPIAPIQVRAGETSETTLSATDPDADPVTYSILLGDNLPTGSLRAGKLTFSPTPDEVGDYTLTIMATDGVLESPLIVQLDVLPPLSPVIASPPPQQSSASTESLAEHRYNRSAKDVYGGPLLVGADARSSQWVDLHSGELRVDQRVSRIDNPSVWDGVTLSYDSQRANPKQTVYFSESVETSEDLLLTASLEVQVGNFTSEVATGQWTMPAGPAERAIAAGDAKLQAQLNEEKKDAAFQPRLLTGTLTTKISDLAGNPIGQSNTRSIGLVNVNSVNSPYGAGWGIDGHQQLFENEDGVVLLIDGDSTERVFQPTLPGQPYESPDGDFSTLLKNEFDGTFRRILKDQTEYQFDAAGLMTRVVDRNGNQMLADADGDGKLGLNDVKISGSSTSVIWSFGYEKGKLKFATDPAGRVTEFEHDSAGNLTQLINPDGTRRSFEYDGAHNLTAIVDELGNRQEFVYNIAGQVGRVIAADDSEIIVSPAQSQGLFSNRIERDSPPPIMQLPITPEVVVADGNGNTTVSTINQAGRTLSKTDGEGLRFELQRDVNHLVTSYTSGRGHETQFTYDARGNLVTSEDEVGEQRFTYDPVFSQMTSHTDELGNLTQFQVDPGDGNMLSTTDALNNTSHFTYTPAGQVATATDPRDHTTVYQYDDLGNPMAVTRAVGTPDEARIEMGYDAAGNRTHLVDANGNRTEFEYDIRNNRLLLQRDAALNQTAYQYDDNGNVTAVIDARGNTTRMVYDALDRIEAVVDSQQSQSVRFYDPAGNITAVVDPLGLVDRTLYDTRNRATTTIDAAAGTTSRSFDADGNVMDVTDLNDNTTRFEYDARGRTTSTTDPQGSMTLFEYDAVDNLVERQDRNGRRMENEYDALRRLKTQTWFDSGGTEVNVIHNSYDANSNLIFAGDNSSQYRITYDALNRGIIVDNRVITPTPTPDVPPPVILTYEYDDVGNVISLTDEIAGQPGRRTSYTYDQRNLMTSVTTATAGPISMLKNRVAFAYNELGQPDTIQRFDLSVFSGTPSVTTQYSYDSLNRVQRIEHANSIEIIDSFDIEYDASSRINQIDDILDTTNYTYDARDQLVSANHQDPALADEIYAYDAHGNRTESHLHGDAYETGPYDQLNSDGTYDYEYDLEGNLILRTEIATGAVRELTWDHLNRLTEVVDTLPGGHLTVTPDGGLGIVDGETFTIHDGPLTVTFEFDRDLIILAPGNIPVFFSPLDSAEDVAASIVSAIADSGLAVAATNLGGGELQISGSPEIVIDVSGSPGLSLRDGALAQRVEYAYDVFGRRILKLRADAVDEVIEHYVYDREDVYLDFVDHDGRGGDPPELDRRYLHGPGIDNLLAEEQAGQLTWHLRDHLNSLRAVTDESGELLYRVRYDSYGNALDLPATEASRFLFTGREFDAETGLYYYRARYYDPQIGRFVSEDPIGFAGGDTNLYAYVGNDPVNETDPSGAFSEFDFDDWLEDLIDWPYAPYVDPGLGASLPPIFTEAVVTRLVGVHNDTSSGDETSKLLVSPAAGNEGPDLYHYMLVDRTGTRQARLLKEVIRMWQDASTREWKIIDQVVSVPFRTTMEWMVLSIMGGAYEVEVWNGDCTGGICMPPIVYWPNVFPDEWPYTYETEITVWDLT